MTTCITCDRPATHGPRCAPCNTQLGQRVEANRARCVKCGASAKNTALFAQPGQPYACAQHRHDIDLDYARHRAELAQQHDQENNHG